MGLVLKGIHSPADPEVSVDPYVPLTLQWPKYLATLSQPDSVVLSERGVTVEIKTSPVDGEILEFILVEGGSVRVDRSVSMTMPEYTPGVPLLVGATEVGYEPSVHLYANGIRVQFNLHAPMKNIGSARAVFGFSEAGQMVCLDVPLSPSEAEVVSP
ncbi:hypothetical protein ACFWDI_23545 [Streptomyces sp. NPDC060064]|uniref:hypothetical protein n=1 Tax=Streptomyces sp. NPDC060064 TaxID=3347049 RepID=UPI00368AF8A1